MSRSTFGWCKCTTICSDSFFPNIGDMRNHFNSLWIQIILTSAFWNPLLITSIYVLCIMIVIDLWYRICPVEALGFSVNTMNKCMNVVYSYICAVVNWVSRILFVKWVQGKGGSMKRILTHCEYTIWAKGLI